MLTTESWVLYPTHFLGYRNFIENVNNLRYINLEMLVRDHRDFTVLDTLILLNVWLYGDITFV